MKTLLLTTIMALGTAAAGAQDAGDRSGTNPETRILKQVTIDNAANVDYIFSMLMGDDVAPRREFIEKNATYANIDA